MLVLVDPKSITSDVQLILFKTSIIILFATSTGVEISTKSALYKTSKLDL